MKKFTWKKGVKIPYEEDLDEIGYSYVIHICWDNREGIIFICECGVHYEWKGSPGFIDTNIKPEAIFGKLDKLENKHLKYITALAVKTGFEGFRYSGEEIDKMYETWLKKNKY